MQKNHVNIQNKDIVTVSFDIAFGGRSGVPKTGQGGDANQIIRLSDASGNTILEEKYKYNSNGIYSSTMGVTTPKGDLGVPDSWGNTSWSDKVHFDYTFDYAKYTLTRVITKKDGVTTISQTIDLPETVGYVNNIFVQSENIANSERGLFIDNIVATTTEGDYSLPTFNYTINYKDGDNIVKTVTGTDYDGNTITATAVVDGEGDYAGNHYLIIAETAPSIVLSADGTNVLDVPVRAPYTATLSVTTTVGGTSNVVNTPLTETDDKVCAWLFAYPKYTLKDGVYYICDETTFVQNGTFTNGEIIEKTVGYSTADANIVAVFEAEAVSGKNALYSNGAFGTVAAQNARNRGIAAGTLTPGAYQFIGQLVADGNSGRAITIREGANDPMASLVANNTTKLETADFVVNSTTGTLYINGANSGEVKTNLSTSFDYVLIRKTATSLTIGTAGWATLYTPYALDFSGVDGLTAYTATCDGSTVTLTEVENVPANTGVVLKGAANTYSIPVITSSETAKGNLTGNATEATAFDAVTGHTYYVLAPSEDANYKVQFRSVTSGSIAAGKAFLDVAGAGVKAFSVKFADADAIRSIENESSMFNVESSKVYNLAGQRMSKLQKGINIVNGKKVLVK